MIIESDDHGAKALRFQPGPIFANLVLADEINRATPKTQSALLEAMQERTVTSGTTTHELEAPFLVMATQNPIEMEGTYPLPEAQLDRFLLKIRVGYPSEAEEAEILQRWEHGFDSRRFESIAITPIDPAWLSAAREEIEKVTVEPSLYKYLVTLVRRTRDWPALTLGASPRAAIGLFFVARALAGIEGRDFLIPDDIKSAAPAVLRHRVLLKPEADLEGLTADQVVSDLLAAVEVPK
jgi:MoxR-like ATPase